MKDRIFRACLGILTALAFILVLIPSAPVNNAQAAEAENKPTPTPIQDYVNKEQYLNGYYRGYIKSDTATVRPGPGSKAYPELKLDDGTVVKLTKGTEVFVWGETKDVDLDVWYHITAEFKGQQIEGYLYIGRVTRENTQILFTPTPTPEPTATPVPVITDGPAQITTDPTFPTLTPTLPPNMNEIVNTPKKNHWIPILIVCLVLIALVAIYSIFQRVQEKKLEEEMERFSKSHRPMERIDGESEDDFNTAKKQYYASMNIGRPNGVKTDRVEDDYDDFDIKPDLSGVFDDDFDEKDVALGSAKKAPKEDIYEEDGMDLSDDDVKVVDDFRSSRASDVSEKKSSSDSDFSDEDIAYFNRLKGKTETPSNSAIAGAGSASSILDESPLVGNYFEDDAPTPEEILRGKLDALRPDDRFTHKLYGEGEVIDNTDSDVIQVRFGRDLRFLKKDKLAEKNLIEL